MGVARARVGALTALLCAGLVAGCGSLPPRGDLQSSVALPPAQTGLLHEASGRIVESLAPAESAFWLLDAAAFSFDVRLALVDEAVSSLDIQYFIWEKDASSRLYAHRVLQAADRGVRVRLLLDDLTLNQQDHEFYALTQHPNIEVRTFNPWNLRTNLGRVLELGLRFGHLNHRMHNKIILADGRFAIIGGRNIGDRYFGLWDDFVQNDLDIMAAGPIVEDVEASFDLFWNSEESYPLEAVVKPRARRAGLAQMTEFFEDVYRDASDRLQYFPLEPVNWNTFFDEIVMNRVVGKGHLEQDLPSVRETPPTQLYAPLSALLASAHESVLLSSPYLILDDEMAALLERLVARGVEVRIVTNSLASNNHMVAHSGYRRWRKRLLRMGVELYEARDDSSVIDEYSVPPTSPDFLGLHAKAMVVDDRYSYVGSANVDPRSLVLNTELAFFIDSADLAARLSALIERDMAPDAAWNVTLDGRRLRWTNSDGTVKRQPALGLKQRILEFFINLLPLKKQV